MDLTESAGAITGAATVAAARIHAMAAPSFDELYAAHADDVFRRCMLLCQNRADAEDVFQQVWVKVHFQLPKFREDAAPLTWPFRIATNESLNFLRAKKSRPQPAEPVDQPVPDHARDVDSKIDVTKLMRRVSDEERALLALKYLDGYSYSEIAGLMGMGESAVKMRISRLKERLTQP